jgi:serine/threonine protein kinase
LNQLGSGGHSTVRLAIRRSDNLKVVCKFIHSNSVWHWYNDKKKCKKIPMEIRMMQSLNADRQKGIIQYYDHFEMGTKYVIVMEYLGEDWVDLYDYIEMFGPVNEIEALEIFKNVVDIILFFYRKDLIHNDIKGIFLFMNDDR